MKTFVFLVQMFLGTEKVEKLKWVIHKVMSQQMAPGALISAEIMSQQTGAGDL